MTQIATDLRNTQETARRIRFEQTAGNSATNVQDAIAALGAGGGSSITPTIVTFAQSPYVPLAADQLLLVDTTGGAVTINMPASASRNGLALEVKDDKRNANVSAITVNRNGAELIDGDVSVVLDSRGVAMKFAPKTGGYAIV